MRAQPFGIQSAIRRLGAATLTVLLSACHVYVPVESPGPRPGEHVRVLIHPDAARRVSSEIGRPVRNLEGLLVDSADSVRVSVLVARAPQGSSFDELRQVLAIPSSEVIEYQRSELSRERTALLGLGIVAFLGLAVSQLDVAGGGGTGESPTDFSDAPAVPPGIGIPLWGGVFAWLGRW